MEFKVNSTELNKIVPKLYSVTNSKSPIEEYQNFLIEVKDNTLKIFAADAGILLSAEIEIETTEEYLETSFLINAGYLNNIIKSFKDAKISFNVIPNKKVTIITSSAKYEFNILDRENFVLDLPSEEEPSFEMNLNGKRLKRVIDDTSYLLKENLKPAMMGLLFDFKEDGLRIVGTDGYRLIRAILFDIQTEKPVQINIPKKSLQVLSKILETEDFNLSVIHDFAIVKSENYILYTRLIRDKFPNYEAVLLLDNEIVVKVNRRELFEVLSRLYAFAVYDDMKKILFKLEPNKLDIAALDMKNNMFNLNEVIPCKYTGIPMEIGFNCSHLLDAVAHMDTDDDLIIKIKEPTKPILLSYSENNPNEDLLVLVMPMRINKRNDN